VYVIPRLIVYRISTVSPYTLTSVNFNNLEKYYEEYFIVYNYLFPIWYLELLDSLRLRHAE